MSPAASRNAFLAAAAAVCAAYVAGSHLLGNWHWTAIPLAAAALGAAAGLLLRARTADPADEAERTGEAADQDAERVAAEFAALGHREGKDQVLELSRKYANLVDILRRRLSPSEVSYGRYLGMANVVYHGAVENMKDIAIGLRNLDGIAPSAAPRRFSDLRGGRIDIPAEVRAVADRKVLYKEEHDRLVRLVGETEEAMTAIDRASTAIARTRTERATEVDLADAMKELEGLAGRAGRLAAR